MDNWEIALSVMVGVGLSAACGFRVFIPPLVLCIAGKAGHVTFGQEFAWMDSNVALAAFGLAALLEVGAYYIPWLDNALDTVAAPAAVVAGDADFGVGLWSGHESVAEMVARGDRRRRRCRRSAGDHHGNPRSVLCLDRRISQLAGVHRRRCGGCDHGHPGHRRARFGVHWYAYAGRVHHLPQPAQALPRVAPAQCSR